MQYEVTISVHVPDELADLIGLLKYVAPEELGATDEPEEDVPCGDRVSRAKPVSTVYEEVPVTDNPLREPAAMTAETAKLAAVAWAKEHSREEAVAILAEEFGVKLAEISDEQAPAIHARFGGAA